MDEWRAGLRSADHSVEVTEELRNEIPLLRRCLSAGPSKPIRFASSARRAPYEAARRRLRRIRMLPVELRTRLLRRGRRRLRLRRRLPVELRTRSSLRRPAASSTTPGWRIGRTRPWLWPGPGALQAPSSPTRQARADGAPHWATGTSRVRGLRWPQEKASTGRSCGPSGSPSASELRSSKGS